MTAELTLLAFARPALLDPETRNRAVQACDRDAAEAAWVLARANKLAADLAEGLHEAQPQLMSADMLHLRGRLEWDRARLRTTLSRVQRAWRGRDVPYVVFKTFKGSRLGLADLDVYVSEAARARAEQLLIEAGAQPRGSAWMPLLRAAGLAKPELGWSDTLDVDLYDGRPWTSLSAWSEDILLAEREEVVIEGVPVNVPRPAADLLTVIGGTIFTDGKYTMKDAAYAAGFSEDACATARGWATEAGWGDEFGEVLDELSRDVVAWRRGRRGARSFPWKIPWETSRRALAGARRRSPGDSRTGSFSFARDVIYRNAFSRVYELVMREART